MSKLPFEKNMAAINGLIRVVVEGENVRVTAIPNNANWTGWSLVFSLDQWEIMVDTVLVARKSLLNDVVDNVLTEDNRVLAGVGG